jgi:hypothetical protein
MIHCKLEDGMVLKILPIKKRDGTALSSYPVDQVYLSNRRKIVYDDTGNLRKILLKVKSENTDLGYQLLKSFVKRYIICFYHDEKIKYTFVSKTILDILANYNFRSDYLVIDQRMIDTQGHMLPDYRNSKVVKKESNVDFLTLLNNEKVYIEDIVSKNNIVSNINILKEEGLYGYLSEVISDERDKKISEILTE